MDYSSPLYNQDSTETATEIPMENSVYETEIPMDESVYSTEIPQDNSAASGGAEVSE